MNKRITVIELIIIVFALSVSALFLSPHLFTPKQELQEATVRAHVGIAVSSISSVFALRTKDSLNEIANVVSNTLNKTINNPVDKNAKAYTVNSAAKGSVSFVVDDSSNSIIINGYAGDTRTPVISQIIPRK
ncbi:MAG: hypothetical protein A2Y25_00765 [Candidatus Melainabacteria bacterium GWF2_37_15]|nr:MAG: hypothetical protein A2Y25_00765 [Candidatus Melainabacteria bacterium GWF2_37_15]